MNEEVILMNEWFDSAEGVSCSTDSILANPSNPAQVQYLRNRLYKAFQAGVRAGEKISRDKIMSAVAKVIGDVTR